jgi:P-type E1-E2 ATPase
LIGNFEINKELKTSMLIYQIPGRETLEIHHLVLDFNGTFALDGKMLPNVAERLQKLSESVRIYVISGDTNGSVRSECGHLPLTITVLDKEDQAQQKRVFVESLEPQGTIAVGNGANDEGMFEAADLAIAVIGGEGCCTSSLLKSDLVVKDAVDAFDLLIRQNRIVGTLRK